MQIKDTVRGSSKLAYSKIKLTKDHRWLFHSVLQESINFLPHGF